MLPGASPVSLKVFLTKLNPFSAVLSDVLHNNKGVPTTATTKLSKNLVLKVRESTMSPTHLIRVDVRLYLTSVNLVDITIDIPTFKMTVPMLLLNFHVLIVEICV